MSLKLSSSGDESSDLELDFFSVSPLLFNSGSLKLFSQFSNLFFDSSSLFFDGLDSSFGDLDVLGKNSNLGSRGETLNFQEELSYNSLFDISRSVWLKVHLISGHCASSDCYNSGSSLYNSKCSLELSDQRVMLFDLAWLAFFRFYVAAIGEAD